MFKFKNEKLAGELVVFSCGEILLDEFGFFEIEDEELANDLKTATGFQFIYPEEVVVPVDKKIKPAAEPKEEVAPKVEVEPETEETEVPKEEL